MLETHCLLFVCVCTCRGEGEAIEEELYDDVAVVGGAPLGPPPVAPYTKSVSEATLPGPALPPPNSQRQDSEVKSSHPSSFSSPEQKLDSVQVGFSSLLDPSPCLPDMKTSLCCNCCRCCCSCVGFSSEWGTDT